MRLPRRLVLTVFAVAGVFAAAPSAHAQELQTWDMSTPFATKADALFGLSGAQAAAEGPTGIRVRVILPDGYTTAHCWPVLYLLHGTGSATAWADEAPHLRALKAIVVAPGTGNTQFQNWYSNGNRRPAWERWFFEQLIPTVEKRLAICPQRSMHSIAGNSAGGGAAYYLASQQPQRFGSAGAFSGAVNELRPEIPVAWKTFNTIFGPPGGPYAEGNNPMSVIDGLRNTRLYMTYGDGQPLPGDDSGSGFEVAAELEMRAQSQDFLAAARREHVRVDAHAVTGMHTMINWQRALDAMIAWNPFAPVVETPRTWTVRTISRQGNVWGYRFRFAGNPKTVAQFARHGNRLRVTGVRGRLKITPPAGRAVSATAPFDLVGDRAFHLNASGTATSGGGGYPPLGFAPLHPTTRQAITLAWPNHYKPRKGRHLQLIAYQSGQATCDTATFTDVRWRKGRTLTRSVRPPLRPGGKRRWCDGSVIFTLQEVPDRANAASLGRILRIKTITFRR